MRKLVVVAPLVLLLTSCGQRITPTSEVTEIAPVEVVVVQDVVEDVPTEVTPEVEPVVEPEVVEYRVTAYCPCEKCCGEWAKDRPVNDNGEPIVYGAWWGKELTSNYSAASPMAFGTKVDLEGFGVVEVQDRTADWVVEKHGENIIDIYMTDHDEAWNFGVQYLKGELVD